MRPNMTVSMFIFIHNKAFTNTQTDVLFVPTIEKGISYYGSLAKFERMYTNSHFETYMS